MESANRTLRTFVIAAMAVLVICALAFILPGNAQAAAKKKVWVVTNATVDNGYATTKHTLTYKKGLLVKDKSKGYAEIWTYDAKGHYKSAKSKYNGGSDKYKLKFDKKKRVSAFMADAKDINYWKVMYNAKGRCKKYGSGTVKYNAKGYLTKLKEKVYTLTLTRDEYGSITKATELVTGSKRVSTFENTYENGRLASWTTSDGGSGSITYKQISVPKKFAAKAKAQQRWVLDNLKGCRGVQLVVVNK